MANVVVVPPLGWVERAWVSSMPDDLLSRRQRNALPTTYRAAVVPPISALTLSFSAEQAARIAEAEAAIVRLDAQVGGVLGGHDVAPLASVLLRSESAASSQIEHLTVGAKQLAIAELGAAASANARLVAANVHAMRAAIDLADRLDFEAILTMHRTLLGGSGPESAGRWRDVQVWIGASSISPAEASYVPPPADAVSPAMDDLSAFLRRGDLPVLVHAAIAHAQFETIHPFTDGNGRVGRALVHSLLRHHGLTRRITLPVSAGLLVDTEGYVEALEIYRRGDAWPIIEAFAAAAERAVGLGGWLLDRMERLLQEWTDTLAPRAGSAAAALLPVLATHPALDVAFAVEALGVSETAARRAVDQLAAAGILSAQSDRKRNRVWVADDVTRLLDDFAERAGRRS